MALFLQKPVFWNENNYVKPSGVKATAGFPEQYGYGYEEWNNSPRMKLEHKGSLYRVFHTEPTGNAPLEENIGQTFVFMMASHDRVQQLVGVAANAIGMMDDKYKKQRIQVTKQLGLGDLWTDAWSVPTVRAKHGNSISVFKKHWKQDTHWVPNWICRDEYYWWLDEPLTLDPESLIGKKRFLSMFGSYTALDQAVAINILSAIPSQQRGEKWKRISDAIQCAPSEPVPGSDFAGESEAVTDVLAQVNARRGQGRFRDDLMKIWGNACAVTGLDCSAALKASHVKPWSKSTSREKLDGNNGLILSATLDSIFDKGLITFEDSGGMRVSSLLSNEQRTLLAVPQSLRLSPSEALRRYLQHHRDVEFLR